MKKQAWLFWDERPCRNKGPAGPSGVIIRTGSEAMFDFSGPFKLLMI